MRNPESNFSMVFPLGWDWQDVVKAGEILHDGISDLATHEVFFSLHEGLVERLQVGTSQSFRITFHHVVKESVI